MINKIDIEIDKNIYVPVSINRNGPYQFILDTGAVSPDVSPDVVEELKLDMDERECVCLERFSIGGIERRDYRIATRDESDVSEILQRKIDGFLGFTFLEDLVVEIDYLERTLFLKKPEEMDRRCSRRGETEKRKGKSAQVELRIDNRYTLVPACVNGDGPHYFLIDTGASRSIISPELAQRLDLERGKSQTARGVEGGKECYASTVKTLEVGGIRRTDLPVTVLDCSRVDERIDSSIEGYIGNDFFSGLVVTIHYPEQLLILREG